MPLLDFEAIKCRITVPHALGLIGWRYREARGDNYRGPCPIHGRPGQPDRSFSVTSTEWYCHKCRKGGDVLLLWAAIHHAGLYTAAVDLCRAAGMEAPVM
jgi:CHC2 zinc finger